MASSSVEIPDKGTFRIGEVCQITDTQPYVLRFWESEFPTLAPQKTRSGQRLYRRADIEMVLRIKHLLYEESYTIAGARKQLETADSGLSEAGRAPSRPERQTTSRKSQDERLAADRDERLEWVRNELRDLLDILGPDGAARR